MPIGESPLRPSQTRPGYALIPSQAEIAAGVNTFKTMTPKNVADNYIGYYSATRNYTTNQCVFSSAGILYRALQPSIGIALTNTSYWQTEVNALPYGTPLACPATGPDGAADKLQVYKSPLGEYWQWLGDAWRVTSGLYATSAGVSSSTLTANTPSNIVSVTSPRAGKAYLRAILSHANASNSFTILESFITRLRSGVTTTVLDSFAVHTTGLGTQYSQTRPFSLIDAMAGDVYTLVARPTQNMDASPLQGSGIFLEYRP